MLRREDLIKIEDWLWEIPMSFRSDMRVPARVYASEKMLADILHDRSLEQLVNVATLPGICGHALAMPDVHEGYGFPVGGVAAFDLEQGIISPGGIGYDVNCGIRLLRSERTLAAVQPQMEALVAAINRAVPSGVGRGGRLKLKGQEFDRVLSGGAPHMVELGYGDARDLECQESGGRLENADPKLVSDTAKKRGADQLGTMGAGNHFVEIDVVELVYDRETAQQLHVVKDQVVVLIHTGSRGLGHQVATDYIRLMMSVMVKYGITLPDRELACAPFHSPEGQRYFGAMAAAANFAWANRQAITDAVRRAWQSVLGAAGGPLHVVYDVAHNIAKVEAYVIGGNPRHVVVHRKGATRAFPGNPVLIPGSMGTHSYVLSGQESSLAESFGSTCHGAGRRMSRTQAKRQVNGGKLRERLRAQGVIVSSGSLEGLAEEAPEAYKDIDAVVDVVHRAGIARKVARLKPVAVVKG